MASILSFRHTTPSTGTVMSLGGANSVTAVNISTAMNNLFDNVTPDEATTASYECRAIDIYNSGDATATNITFWFTQPTPGAVKLRAWLETANSGGNHTSGLGAWTGLTVTHDPDTVPTGSGLSAGSPAGSGATAMEYTVASKLTIADISATNSCRIWIQRYVPSGTANSASETATMTLEYA